MVTHVAAQNTDENRNITQRVPIRCKFGEGRNDLYGLSISRRIAVYDPKTLKERMNDLGITRHFGTKLNKGLHKGSGGGNAGRIEH